MANPQYTITDADGRVWDVYGWSLWAGTKHRQPVGGGAEQYRGFDPVDGGARRVYRIWPPSVAQLPVTPALLLEQLAKSALYPKDDPDVCAKHGWTLDRSDSRV